MQAMKLNGIDKSAVSRTCKALDEVVTGISKLAFGGTLSIRLVGCHEHENAAKPPHFQPASVDYPSGNWVHVSKHSWAG